MENNDGSSRNNEKHNWIALKNTIGLPSSSFEEPDCSLKFMELMRKWMIIAEDMGHTYIENSRRC